MREVESSIDISASPERVWEVLTDLPSFSEWNPFMSSAAGEVRPGERLTVRLNPPGGMAMTFKPTVLKADEGREFRWMGRLVLPGVFDGEHFFLIEPREGGGVRLTQGERFTGALVPVMGLLGVYEKTEAGFQQMNRALKERAESGAGSSP